MRAEHARGPLIQYWREEGWIPALGGRNDGGVGGGWGIAPMADYGQANQPVIF